MSSAETEGPFSHPSRLALIDAYFAQRKVAPGEAWKDVYRLLLWSDPTTGLAHCYESDKAQPGRPWYARTLAFHAWLAREFGVRNDELPDQLDWMFRAVIKRVAAEEAAKQEGMRPKAAEQRAPYQDMPDPGADPELRELIEPLLPAGDELRPTDDVVRDVLRRVRAYIASENKRKNLLGRGFEDVLHGIVQRLQDGAPPNMNTQMPIEEIPGFRAPRSGEKTEKVDLWVGSDDGRRILVSAKWSVRADREKQMRSDFQTYVDCNATSDPFEYVWITNEFDPARLVANATATAYNAPLFTAVVHVNPGAVRLVHQLDNGQLRSTRAKLEEQLVTGQIVGLGDWLKSI
jgi:hypothetical protein